MTKRKPTANVDWAVVQLDYETHILTNDSICLRHGITRSQLRYRAERFGWVAYRTRRIEPAVLTNRMLKIFDRHLRQLEKSEMTDKGKDINLLATATKTLDKIMEFQGGDTPKPVEEDDMADLRDKLAERLDQLKKR
jgi:hypothetical protein